MNAFGQGAEIADALEFVVRQLDVEVLLDARQQIERLQAVDSQLLEEIVVGRELLARHLEMRGGQIQHFVGGVLSGCSSILSCHNSRVTKPRIR